MENDKFDRSNVCPLPSTRPACQRPCTLCPVQLSTLWLTPALHLVSWSKQLSPANSTYAACADTGQLTLCFITQNTEASNVIYVQTDAGQLNPCLISQNMEGSSVRLPSLHVQTLDNWPPKVPGACKWWAHLQGSTLIIARDRALPEDSSHSGRGAAASQAHAQELEDALVVREIDLQGCRHAPIPAHLLHYPIFDASSSIPDLPNLQNHQPYQQIGVNVRVSKAHCR